MSQRNAIFMENEVNGIHVDAEIIERFAGLDRAQGEELGLEVSVKAAQAAAPYADGFYLMTPFNRIALMERLIARLKDEGIADRKWPMRLLWPLIAEKIFLYLRLSWPAGHSKRVFTNKAQTVRCIGINSFEEKVIDKSHKKRYILFINALKKSVHCICRSESRGECCESGTVGRCAVTLEQER